MSSPNGIANAPGAEGDAPGGAHISAALGDFPPAGCAFATSALQGNYDTLRSLATLAYEGRRPAFAQAQLIAALQILQNGDIQPEAMLGSWAGAMGQTQFIPTTYNTHAVDFDGDGRRDIWGSPADALASTAHYLQSSGWQRGQPWGFEVQLPSSFNYTLADGAIRKSVAEWRQLGVILPNGGQAPAGCGSDA